MGAVELTDNVLCRPRLCILTPWGDPPLFLWDSASPDRGWWHTCPRHGHRQISCHWLGPQSRSCPWASRWPYAPHLSGRHQGRATLDFWITQGFDQTSETFYSVKYSECTGICLCDKKWCIVNNLQKFHRTATDTHGAMARHIWRHDDVISFLLFMSCPDHIMAESRKTGISVGYKWEWCLLKKKKNLKYSISMLIDWCVQKAWKSWGGKNYIKKNPIPDNSSHSNWKKQKTKLGYYLFRV